MKNELINRHLPDLDYLMQKPEVRQYKVIELNLTQTRTDKLYAFYGNFLSVNGLTVEATKTTKVRINSKNNDLITLTEGNVIQGTIHKIYVTNDVYGADSKAELVIGIGFKIK